MPMPNERPSVREPSWWNFIKEAFIDLALTLVTGAIIFFAIRALGYDEQQLVGDALYWFVTTFGIYR